jgi:uncharacterized damage-inducible protein DinB
MEHLVWADTAILKAVRAHPGASADEEMRKVLNHIAGVQRAFVSLFLNRPFDIEKEMRIPDWLDETEGQFRAAHAEELAFVNGLDELGLARVIAMKWIPGLQVSVAEALVQVAMHSQSHRGQCASRLRSLGGKPPMTDFIIWLKERSGDAA